MTGIAHEVRPMTEFRADYWTCHFVHMQCVAFCVSWAIYVCRTVPSIRAGWDNCPPPRKLNLLAFTRHCIACASRTWSQWRWFPVPLAQHAMMIIVSLFSRCCVLLCMPQNAPECTSEHLKNYQISWGACSQTLVQWRTTGQPCSHLQLIS